MIATLPMSQVQTDIEAGADLEEEAGGVAVASGSEAAKGRDGNESGAEGGNEFGQRIKDAMTSEELDALIDDMPEPQENAEEERQEESDESLEVVDEEEDSEDDDAGEEDEGSEGDDSDKEDEESEEDDDSEDGDSDEEEDSGDEEESENPKFSRFRLRPSDQVEQEALSLKKRNPDMSLEDCVRKAKQKLGVKDEAAVADESGHEDGGDQGPDLEAMQAEVDELWENYDKAQEELEEDKAKDYRKKAVEKQKELAIFQAKAEVERDYRKRQAQEEFNQKLEQSASRAVELYPWLDDAKDPANERFDEVLAIYQETENPILNTPDYALKIAHQVAAEFGRLPKGKKAPVRKKKEADPENSKSPEAKGKKPTAPIANGKRKSAGNQTTKEGDLIKEIRAAKTPDEVEAIQRRMGLETVY